MTSDPKKAAAMRDQIAGVLTAMEKEAARSNPGIVELMRVYGEYSSSINQMNAYTSAFTEPPPGIATHAAGTDQK